MTHTTDKARPLLPHPFTSLMLESAQAFYHSHQLQKSWYALFYEVWEF